MNITPDFIQKLPKNDIHLHLDGSIRLDTMIELAKQDGVTLPSNTPSGLEETLFKDSYANLEEYLKTFGYSCAVLQKPENLERVAFEIAEDNWQEGSCYIEVRFAPQLLMNKAQNFEQILTRVNAGLEKAQKQCNADPDVVSGKRPPFRYGIIVCAMRFFGPWSEHYSAIYDCMPAGDVQTVIQFGSVSAADAAIRLKNETGMPIVAFDIAGAENGYPAEWHTESFNKIRRANIGATVHAGEAYGPESVKQALFDLHTERIGHGFQVFIPERVTHPEVTDKAAYTKGLIDYITRRQIPFEVCLTSNIQTTAFLNRFADHPFGKMIAHGAAAAICTDNRTVSKTTVSKELSLAVEHFKLSPEQLKAVVMTGFRHAFFHGTAADKKSYVELCERCYDRIAATQ